MRPYFTNTDTSSQHHSQLTCEEGTDASSQIAPPPDSMRRRGLSALHERASLRDTETDRAGEKVFERLAADAKRHLFDKG